MSLTSENMGPADIKAVTGSNDGWGNSGWFDLIILFFFFMMYGWGNNGWGNAGGPTSYQTSAVTQSDMQRGFDQQAVISHLDNLTGAVSNGFANAEISRCNQNQTFTNAITDMGFRQQAQGADISQGIADVKYTIATEGCADRNALSQSMQNLEISLNGKVQTILDKMNQQELEAARRENDNLRQQLYLAQLTASQGQQTANINGNTNAQVQSAVDQLRTPSPIPAYVVPNPAGCNCGNYGMGCCA